VQPSSFGTPQRGVGKHFMLHQTMSAAQAGAIGEQAALRKMLGHRGYNSLECPVYTGPSGVLAACLANGQSHD
jgi:hypothetical protein